MFIVDLQLAFEPDWFGTKRLYPALMQCSSLHLAFLLFFHPDLKMLDANAELELATLISRLQSDREPLASEIEGVYVR